MIPGASIATQQQQQQQQQQQLQGRGMYCSVPITIHASIELGLTYRFPQDPGSWSNTASCRSVESYIVHLWLQFLVFKPLKT